MKTGWLLTKNNYKFTKIVKTQCIVVYILANLVCIDFSLIFLSDLWDISRDLDCGLVD